MEVLCTPFVGQAHAEGAVVAIRDLSERRRLEAERLTAEKQRSELDQLREQDQFKTRFMNMAAHELNTPLTPIGMQMHLLKKGGAAATAASSEHSIEVLDRNFRRLQGLVADLLDSSRLQSDRMPMRPREEDLVHVVAEVVDTFRPAAAAGKVELDAQLPPLLMCTMDPDRITQAVTNLVSNALKFTPAGGSVTVACEQDDASCRIRVTDTGVGLSPAQAARLFRPFEQVHESQVSSKVGSGLGLYITRGILEMHGGTASVTSPGPGQGCSFTLTFPRNRPSPAVPPAA
jgi:signal transduction histidine kinase